MLNKGLRGFITRGIKAVKIEFNIICAAMNLKRIWIKLQRKNGKKRDILYQPA